MQARLGAIAQCMADFSFSSAGAFSLWSLPEDISQGSRGGGSFMQPLAFPPTSFVIFTRYLIFVSSAGTLGIETDFTPWSCVKESSREVEGTKPSAWCVCLHARSLGAVSVMSYESILPTKWQGASE